ncbi:MAG: 2-C-methyl-D-erythritol 2,4-cyclodiphosphate synthase [endosymbiont of Galathealinum brachiosum]|uniref:2-C-methyl-D-erythritol 2,4-cyclodiphosphate synthase n=1 Tax=endosymbiont of Galathealinum brachiosum TaxID=2200906 RepID=A0A370DGF5_9GAMM|nr:MAG: 2-C-methyl-D-erythritol 2,4-cyclodiphosphate synthase [endosymbiont of Galathealinum brachiosum]
MIRIGHGYDVHAFEPGEFVILAGVKIPYQKQFKAHSDGDVLIHAVCDALLGAIAQGDIGHHFPDTDSAYKGVNSRDLLKKVYELVIKDGFNLSNIDVTIIAQAPKISPFIETMRANLATDLEADISQVNVKATTTEKLGFIGKEEGIAVHSVCLIEKNA